MPTRGELCSLVHEHLSFVYSSALRQAHGDLHLAEDITQAVFIILARKLPSLRRDVILRDWLFVTTRYAAKNAMKMEARRRYHERRAAAERCEEAPMKSSLESIAPVLDEAIARLSDSDRAGVLLSFFDNKTFCEVGAALGVSEEAARKRVHRAVEKLRSFFAARGIVMSASSIAIVAASHAPVAASLNASVLAAAVSASGGAGKSLAIAKGVNQMIALMKLKLAATCVVACAVVGGAGATIIATASQSNAPATAPAATPAKQDENVGVAKFDDDVVIEIAGLAKNEARAKWWRADGSPADAPCDRSTSQDDPPLPLAICLRVSNVPDDAGVKWILPFQNWSSQRATSGGTQLEHSEIYVFKSDSDELDVRCRLATGQWQDTFQNDGPDNSACRSDNGNAYAISAGSEKDGKAVVSATYHVDDAQARLIAIDTNGNKHVGSFVFTGMSKWFTMVTVTFDIPLSDVTRTVLQTRPYDHDATFKHVTLDPARKTKPEVTANKS